MDPYLVKYYPEACFGGFADVDGTVIFYSRIRALCDAESIVLDVGCGRGEFLEDRVRYRRETRNLRGSVSKLIGIDVDPVGQENPAIDEFRKIKSVWPIEDASIDLAYADCVLEHVPDPPAFFREANRVLRSGGYLCVRTTNLRSYVGLIASLVPNRHHAKVVKRVQDERQEKDVFPTTYRCNTIRKARRLLSDHGFDGVVYGYDAQPSYLVFSGLAYRLGVWHQKLAPGFIKPSLFMWAQKRRSEEREG